jgi:hypothetical protein
MRWDYGISDSNCWKSGKFSLGAVLLGMAWKLSQMMRPTLVLSTDNCQTLLLVRLDPRWIPLGECAPLSLEKCVLVIPPSESDEMCLKMTALVYWEMGWKCFLEYGPMLALEPILPGWDKSTKNPLRSCALTLDECTLAVENCVTAAEE